MAKLKFPATGAPSSGFISEMRTWLKAIATHVQFSPSSKAAVNANLGVLAEYTDLSIPLAPDTAAVTDGQVIRDAGGTFDVTVNVTNNVVSVVVNPVTE